MKRGSTGFVSATGITLLVVASLLALALTCGCARDDTAGSDRTRPVPLRLWAMGREGEVVTELVDDFQAKNPDIRVDVQQIPWSAAHEKLLTAYVGRSTPDLAQLGNTWISEFVAFRALEPLGNWLETSAALRESDFFAGIWQTNLIDDTLYGVPWYVDTRVLFYRTDILARAGYQRMPTTWPEWREAMRAVKRSVGQERFAIILPINEWTQPAILGLQAGSPLLTDNATRGAFAQPEFQRAFTFYVDLFREKLAPPVSNNEISNVYQEFARGYFAMYVTGPWNLGEFRRRLPDELQDSWMTAPMPGPDASTPGISLAGGASLVMFRNSPHKKAAWRLIEYLSQPQQQVRFYELTGDLPAHRAAWQDTALSRDPHLHAFAEQLQNVVATPKIPEWEQIAIRLQERAEQAIRGADPLQSVLKQLDQDADRFLEKRRWLLEHGRLAAAASEEAR